MSQVIRLAACALTIQVLAFATKVQADAQRSTCQPSHAHQFVCGAERPEDLARIPNTRWLIASGFQEGAGLKIVDTRARTLRSWYTGKYEQVRARTDRFPNCASAPDPKLFNAQGIALRSSTPTTHTLYVANHGGRESVEVFEIDSSADEPTLVWAGCVLMPDATPVNSVAAFSDGTVLASVLTRPGTSITDFVKGRITGGVYQWRPGDVTFSLLPGTALPGNNGIETSKDDREFYVVAFPWRTVLVYSRYDTTTPVRRAIAPGFMPDNIHWDGDKLILAGMQHDEPACGGTRKLVKGEADPMRCHRGYVVAELDPMAMEFRVIAYAEPDPSFNGVSVARIVGDKLWLGSYQANRLAYRLLPEQGTKPTN